ncbi:BgTH12-03836 [Blumeria graminis f. sp. triticale]|uniref:BgtA-20722 n=3 Tax=Blumeria graminis TaxID=34373 RepID=A0A9X9L958_BLUGR|nr:hypothetical protein BGT96224_A20722 [Blumeria graminis f. sp. tritici 96224]CAD6499728.1 BgTH12-03836 [Blumeria graminis f. sp. triticale]VCU39897.1 BgtA-20722 [Blumeria graminis f. sp. tritici]
MSNKKNKQESEVDTSGDMEEEKSVSKSAEDRKAAAALSSIEREDEDSNNAKDIDHEAVRKAMERLDDGNSNGVVQRKVDSNNLAKSVKYAPADINLIVEELELSKSKANELLRLNDGDLEKALRQFIRQPL